jgi:hypothetical protein
MARADKPKLLHDSEKAASRDEQLAEIEGMIARLRKLREHERDSVVAGAEERSTGWRRWPTGSK